MHHIITSLAREHGLTAAEVMAEIEATFSSTLSQWYRMEVMVFFREDLQLQAVAYDLAGGLVMQRLVDFSEIKGRNTLRRLLAANLAKAAVTKQAANLKPFERKLLWGEITGRDREQNLLVEVEIIPGERLTALCPLNRLGLHERHSRRFAIGQHRAFHLRQVEPVLRNNTPRLKVVVDRVSKTLVENLLRERLGAANRIAIRCTKRYVGQRSVVIATGRLPRAAIVAVDRELGERVQVTVVRELP